MRISKTLLTCGAAALCLVAVSARAADTESEAKLREALRQKMAELGPETPAPAPASVAPAPVAPAPVTTKPVVVQPAPTATTAQTAPVADDAEAARLREAMRVRLEMEQATPTPAQPIVTQTPASTVAPVGPNAEVKSPAKAPVVIQAPALPISASKEQRLANLLQQYKTDQITPQEYHEQRAKIIAE